MFILYKPSIYSNCWNLWWFHWLFEITRVLFYCRIQKSNNCCVSPPLFPFPPRMQSVGLALEELLVTAQKQDCLTIGIYESAKLLNAWVGAINFGVSLWPNCLRHVTAYSSHNSHFPLASSGTQTMWSCVSWQLTMKKMWRCKSTSPCCSRSAATAASPSCESLVCSGSTSCWEQWMPTKTRKSTVTFTACWLRYVDSVCSYITESGTALLDSLHAVAS